MPPDFAKVGGAKGYLIRMRVYVATILSTVLILLPSCSISQSEPQAPMSLSQKVSTLNDLSLRRPVIRLDGEKFKNLVRSAPRNYSMFIMFTALKPQRGCSVCKQASDEFQILANSYMYSPGRSSALYFAMVDFDDAQDAFQSMKLNTAPVFIRFPPKGKPKKADTFEVQRHGFDAEVLYRFISEKTGVQFRVMRPPNYFMNIVLLMTVALLAGLIYLKRDSLDFLFQKSTWGVIVISFILVMMSGQMWNQIRGASFAHRDPRTGAMSYIHGSSQGQFVMETYIVMGLHGAISIGVILMNEANTMKDLSDQQRKGMAGIGFAMLVFFFSVILAIFRSKYQGYPYSLGMRSHYSTSATTALVQHPSNCHNSSSTDTKLHHHPSTTIACSNHNSNLFCSML
ncbi:hypothetical protein EB796_009324 [Bugula neritina]|uniref:TUSC3 n=1 Tax=Bugula neritina TaxID=10212 RepID=A0A7J7K2F2_BUGNE|nr:hypothetical protein EB796_009324 [Bugula neritina]